MLDFELIKLKEYKPFLTARGGYRVPTFFSPVGVLKETWIFGYAAGHPIPMSDIRRRSVSRQ